MKKHWLAIVLAIFLGLTVTGPYVYFRIKLGLNFQGINRQMADDSMFYLARIRDVIDGHPTLSNAYLWEHKNGPPQQLFLAEYLLAKPIEWLRLDIATGQLVYNFILPAVIFLLSYTAIFLIFPDKFWAVILSIIANFGLFLFSLFRPVSPQFNFIFWLSQFIFIWLLINGHRSKKIIAANIINFGLLFYIYPYYWTYYLIFFFLLAAAYFLRNKNLTFDLLKIIIGGLILAGYYFYYSFQASQLPYFEETMTRLQLIYSRFPSGINVLMWSGLLLVLIFVFLRLKLIQMSKETFFFSIGATASIIAVNQHIITNRNFEFSSHYYMLAVFFCLFGIAYLLSHLSAKTLRLAAVISVVLFMILAGRNLIRYSQAYVFDNWNQSQKYGPAIEWLNQNTPPDSVVYASEHVSQLLSVYTANNVFYARYANLFLMSDDEVIERFVINNYFETIDRDFIIANDRAIFGVRYIDRYGHAVQGNKLRRLLGLKLEPEIYLPQPVVDATISMAQKVQSGNFEEKLKKFRVDYIIWDKIIDPNWHFDNQKFVKTIFENRNFKIYKIL